MAKNDQTPVTARPRMGLIPKGSPIVIPVSQSFDNIFRQRHEIVPIRKCGGAMRENDNAQQAGEEGQTFKEI